MEKNPTATDKNVSELLLPRLRAIQADKGFISEDDIKNISNETNIAATKIYEVSTFYSFLSTKKKGQNIIRICNSPSCYINGSENIMEIFKNKLGIDINQTTKDNKFTLETTSCIGCCNQGPSALINGHSYTELNEEKIDMILKKY